MLEACWTLFHETKGNACCATTCHFLVFKKESFIEFDVSDVSEETIEEYGCCLQFLKQLFPMGLGTNVYEYYFGVGTMCKLTHLRRLHIILSLVSPNLGSVIICGQCNYQFNLDNTKKIVRIVELYPSPVRGRQGTW